MDFSKEADLIQSGQWHDPRLYDKEYVDEVLKIEALIDDLYPSIVGEASTLADPSHDRRLLEHIKEKRVALKTSQIWSEVKIRLRQSLFEAESERRYLEPLNIDDFIGRNFLSKKYSAERMEQVFGDDEKFDQGIGNYGDEIQEFLASVPEDADWFDRYAQANGKSPEQLLIKLLHAYDTGTFSRLKSVLYRRINNEYYYSYDYVRNNSKDKNDSEIIDDLTENNLNRLAKLRPYEPKPRIFQLRQQDRQSVCAILFSLTIQYHRNLEKLGVTGAPSDLLGNQAGLALKNHTEIITKNLGVARQMVKFLVRNPSVTQDNLELEVTKMQDAAKEHILVLRNNPDLNNDIEHIETGQTVFAPGEGELRIIKSNKLGSVIEEHLRLAALGRYGANYRSGRSSAANPLGVHWRPTKLVDIANKLTGNFNGRIGNLRFVGLPADPDYFTKFVSSKSGGINQESAIRIGIAVDLKSSGKPAITNLIDVVLYRRDREENDMQVIVSTRGRSKNEDPIEYLHLESIMNGRQLEAQALRQAFSAGAGSLGRRG